MGLNFQTCTIINSILDPDSSKAGKEVKLFEAVNTPIDGVATDVLRIKRDFVFVKDNVKAIRKKAGYEAEACKATIDFSKLTTLIPKEGTNYARLDVYVKYEGAEPFYGANPLHILKGIPFWVEFSVKSTDTAETIAAGIAKQIKKDHLFLIDKDIVDVTVDGGKLVLEGATEYQRFEEVKVSTFGVSDDYSDVIAELGDAAITEDNRGKNSFGTYSQIVKDLRLPTAANYQWTHIRQVETPIVGATYDQYIIEYCAPASNEGTMFVGHRGQSWTTHVFWVKNDAKLISEWETALAVLSGTSTVEEAGESND